MTGPLVPLALGAVVLGWTGQALGGLLEPLLGKAPEVHATSSLGWLAGALGLFGFATALVWQVRRHGQARIPTFGVPFAEILALPGRMLAACCALMHTGRLGMYLFTSVAGVGAVLLWALARSS